MLTLTPRVLIVTVITLSHFYSTSHFTTVRGPKKVTKPSTLNLLGRRRRLGLGDVQNVTIYHPLSRRFLAAVASRCRIADGSRTPAVASALE